MRILADKEIPYVNELFGLTNQLRQYEGRFLSDKHIKNTDVLIVRSITKVDYELLHDSSVKFVGTVTSGTDHIDQDYLEKNNVKYISAPGSNAIAVVEYVFSALFWLAHRDHFFLRDKIVGIIGVGHIGNLLNQRLNSFGVQTLLYDPYLSKINTDKSWKSLEILVSESDILTFHTPLTYTGSYPTWHMVNKDIIEALPSNKTLINTSRGEVFDNSALLKALDHGKKINVILDVWEFEPKLLLPLLFCIDIGTAHIAGYSIESKIRSIIMIYNAFCQYFNISDKINVSNLFPSFINYIRIKKMDEANINSLIKIIYNIYNDHICLKSYALNSGGFDKLRKYYFFRREWSSIFVDTGKDYTTEMLKNFGFSVF
ncbi:erythronate-4-phosphate dehydrogenase [Candidatus Blochmanniella vafra str. BVAF]|uniref:Erythronate-4-phosphate dehydrogenase n=1 Tax=Blochmanniella vafra (strain BVAF) TaxID=859654 RepID=E8Q760_BLOVB|nr:4-phosphoerythronate dehydrogenase [Candidatus Blochmannia vafer]ADV33884.1 erythronate-4-phosphate dehydrogenase [Candidatus Blochmannia vafer str. BVAF]